MIDEKTLTLYYYDDGLSEPERKRTAQAIRNDDLMAARYATLSGELDGLREAEDIPAPEHLKHQWHALIEQQARVERQQESPGRTPFYFVKWGGALASVLVIGIAIGMLMVQKEPNLRPGLVNTSKMLPMTTPVSFQRGVQVYLQDSHGQLARISDYPEDEQALLLMQIVAQNRIFERAAESNNAPEIARLMRAFEPILMQMASEDITPRDGEALRKQLSFELKAMLTKIQRSASEEAQTI